jgi:hypothetical protein
MRTGRLSISRGHRQGATEDIPPPHLALVPPAAGPAPVSAPDPEPALSPDLQAVNERLAALERLVRLYELGALSVEEFAAEKSLILGDTPRVTPVHFVPAEPRRARRGPSLLGRMLSWQFMLLCLAAGIGLSFATQPEATTRFLTQLYHSVAG